VSGTLVNSGNLVVDPAYIVFQADGQDISLIFTAGPLAPGAHATFGFDWNVGDSQTPYTLQAVADPENVIGESDETNNIIDMIVGQPDLQVTWQTTDFSADTITVTLGVANIGAIAAGAPFDVALRAGSVMGAAYATAQIGDDLIPDQEITVQFVFEDLSAVPADATTTYAVADAGNDVTEANEQNNTRRVDVPRRPDLAVGPYDLEGVPSQIVMVHNLGPIGAGSFRVAIYRGDAGQEKLFEANIAQLASGGTAQIPLTGPAGMVPLIVRVDPDNLVVEGDESNNLVSGTVTLWPRWFLPFIHQR
jgi:subtilase family serine protease